MKTRVFLFLMFCLLAVGLQGQTFTDDFNDNAVNITFWGSDSNSGNGRLREQNQRVDYTVSSPSAGADASTRPWVGQLPMSTNWEATVQVHNAFVPSNTTYQWSSIGLQLARPGVPDEIAYLEFYAETDDVGPLRGFLASMESSTEFFGETYADVNVTDAMIRLAYDAATRVVTASYDRDGTASAFGWQEIGSFGLGGASGGTANRNWNLSASQNLTLKISGYSEGATVTAGQMWVDNFILKIQAPPPAPTTTTVSDNFNDNTMDTSKWGTDATFGNGRLLEQNQRLDFVVGTATTNFDQALRPWVGALPVDADWEATLQVHNAYPTTGSQYHSVGLELARPDNPSEAIFIELLSEILNGTLNRAFLTSLENEQAIFGDRYADREGLTDASVRIQYQAAGQIVTTSFDRDGAGATFGWQTLGSFGLNGSGGGLASRAWPLSSTNRFRLYVYGYGEGGATAGQIWADNFSLKIADTVLPELAIAREGANLRISWAASAVGYTLQTKTNVASATWSSITTPTSPNGDRFELVIPVPAQNTFFRLMK